MSEPPMVRARKKKIRLFRAQGGLCFWCKTPVPFAAATLDHVWPRCKGGGWRIANLVMSCEPCNKSKAGNIVRIQVHPIIGIL